MKLLLFIIMLLPYSVNAQNANSIWCFGDSAGINFRDTSNVIPLSTSVRSRGSCTSIADSAGYLLFYANTRAGLFGNTGLLFNANNQLLQNGDSIVGQAWYHEMTIIPKPGNDSLYYIVTAGILNTGSVGFYYSIIDMNANGGLGAVVQKNIQINNFRNADCVTAIQHGNGRDWWVISKYSDMSATSTNKFYIYLVTNGSILQPLIQQFNNVTNSDGHFLLFNPLGDKLMQSNRAGFLCEYDFDRCIGIISNPNTIFTEQTNNFSRIVVDVAYSANGDVLYVSTSYNTNIDTSNLIQYDLTATNIAASADTLFRIAWPVQGGAVRLAPDNKIYYTCFYDWGFPGYPYPDTVRNVYNENLGVIHFPDSLGAACNFQPFSFYLGGKRTYYGLPNNPDYSLGALVGSSCDTITNLTPNPSPKERGELFVFYHNGWQQLFVNAKNIRGKNCLLQVLDMNGKEVFSSTKKTQPPYFTQDVNCGAFADGMYVVSLTTEKESLVTKFVKE